MTVQASSDARFIGCFPTGGWVAVRGTQLRRDAFHRGSTKESERVRESERSESDEDWHVVSGDDTGGRQRENFLRSPFC